MLVIDRVELIFPDQAEQMGKFHRDNTVLRQKNFETFDKIV